MVKDAEAHAEEDKKRKEEIDVRNNADTLVYSTEQTLSELGDKVPADTKSEVEGALNELKEALKGTDVEAIKSATDKARNAGYKLGEIAYQQANAAQQAAGAAGAAGANPGAASTTSGDDDVVDADYEVVDDDKQDK